MSDPQFMARAVELAAEGLGTTSPNPVVGCVVLDAAGDVVGEGWHERAGGPHAEVNALARAGERARGGTAYVTLEPCNHTGRTGPCAQALLDAGIARVVFAVPDPGALAGGGAERLRAAGVEVTGGVLAAEAERVNEAWLTAARSRRPHVTWEFAATLDGRSAAATPAELRDDLHGKGIVSVLLEGGPTLAGSHAVAGTAITTITDAIGLDDVALGGGDVRVSGRPRR